MNKKLFAFDLDGTLLSNSQDSVIPKEVHDIIKRLKQENHIVCLFTGRPWRASKNIYKALDLNTIIVNYNGSHIHNPKDYNFVSTIKRMNVISVMKILNSSKIQMIANNITIEGINYIQLMKFQNSYFIKTFVKTDDKIKITLPIQCNKFSNEPIGILIEIKKEYAKNINQIKDYFTSKYGDLAEFSYWETGANNLPILEITNPHSRKDIALIKVARYYNIDMSNTIAFGDGFNDIWMLKVAGIGVAMANSLEIVKSFANVISKYTNKEGGVAKFIEWYLNKGYKIVDKTIYSIGKPFIN